MASPRVYVLGRRLHHGAVGAVTTVIGIVLMVHDWRDRWWLKDG